MFWKAGPDPIRVIVEQSDSSVWTAWGPLVGVVVGAVLAALGQVVAGRLQRQHDVRRELVAVKRELYGRVLTQVDGVMHALTAHILRLRGDQEGPVADSVRAFASEVNRLTVLQAEAAISGSLEVYNEIVELLGDVGMSVAIDAPGWERLLDAIGGRQAALMALMRIDLGTPGTEPPADYLRTLGLPQGGDLQ